MERWDWKEETDRGVGSRQMHGGVTWALACWEVVGLTQDSPQHHCSMLIAPGSDDPPTESRRCQLFGINTPGELVCAKLGKGPRERCGQCNVQYSQCCGKKV